MNCSELVVRIGQLSYVMRELRRRIEDMVKFLYGREATLRFGEKIEVWEALQAIERDLATGKLKLENTHICKDDRCIDLIKFLDFVDDYYDAFGAKQKLWRDLMKCLEE